MRRKSCLNKFYNPTYDRKMQMKLLTQKSEVNYTIQKECQSVSLIKAEWFGRVG